MKVTWLGHAAHFTGSNQCAFRMATRIEHAQKKVVVSTIGDYFPKSSICKQQVGCDRFFETMVFEAGDTMDCGCSVIDRCGSLDSIGSNTAKEASDNHYAMIDKWMKKLKGK